MTPAKVHLDRLTRNGDLFLMAGVLGVILLMVLPVPPFLLDFMLALSIAMTLLILLVILYVKEPAEFTGFPTLLLFVTLFRLALNIASTRLILLNGFAGNIIEAFGSFVVKGNFVVGLVVFSILVIINFVVITKGAGRIAEVAARFTLDAMPGKQMAIDAELNAGIIDEKQARERRQKIEQESDFYGAMDGASKFVRGDAIAAILITLINVVGGFAIGILQKGMTVTSALELYTLLSIGDGLVSQIPAIITSTAAGILVTRAASKDQLGPELSRQLLLYPRAMVMLTVMLVVFACVPGLPKLPFLALALVVGLVARQMKVSEAASRREHTGAAAGEKGAGPAAEPQDAKPLSKEGLEELLKLEPIQIELGYALVGLADKRKGGDLVQRVTNVRKRFAEEMGIIVPLISLRDNLQLEPNRYRVLLNGNAVADGEVVPNRLLAMNATGSEVTLEGTPTVEPVFKLPAIWITEVERKNAEMAGYTIVDPSSVLVTHISEILKRNCHEILSRQDVQNLLDHLKESNATIINELVPNLLSVGQVQRVLQNLLAEGISIRNLAGILEKVSDHAPNTKNPDELSEQARRALGTQIAKPFQDEQGRLFAITMDPQLEQEIAGSIRQNQTEIALSLEPKLAGHIMDFLSKTIQNMVASGRPPVVVCAPQIRLGFKRFFQSTFAELTVLSYHDVGSGIDVQCDQMVPAFGMA